MPREDSRKRTKGDESDLVLVEAASLDQHQESGNLTNLWNFNMVSNSLNVDWKCRIWHCNGYLPEFILKPGSQMVVHHLFKSFEFLRVVSTSLESIWVKTIIFLSIETFNDGWKNVAETRLLFIREAELHTDLFSSGSWLAGLHRLPNFVRRWLHHRTDPIRSRKPRA